MTKRPKWTSASVLLFAGGRDPVDAIRDRAREIATHAIDAGWEGPPFDPLLLADLLRLHVQANNEVPDARTVPVGRDRLRIEFNPNRPRGRMRYSVAHEIAHTLFPDCSERVRNRGVHEHASPEDDWQLEALCNIAAAEFLMPVGSFPSLPGAEMRIDKLMELRKQFDVSAEALLLRGVQVADDPCAMFCASRLDDARRVGRYRIDYSVGSATWKATVPAADLLPEKTLVADCVRAGYTAHGDESWAGIKVHVEAVGIPPYPGSHYARVVGVVTQPQDGPTDPAIQYVKGSATEPRGDRPKMVVHVVNDATPNWGGAGFAMALARAWPAAREDFRNWAGTRGVLRLGNVRIADVGSDTFVASMIAQRGYGPSTTPRIRYGALQACLRTVAEAALERNATLHMPRIGAGQARGSWEIIKELILSNLSSAGLDVFVYDLPDTDGKAQRPAPQTALDFYPGR